MEKREAAKKARRAGSAEEQSSDRSPEEIAANVRRLNAEADKAAAEAKAALAEAKKCAIESAFGEENTLHIRALRQGQEAQTRQILRQEQEQMAHPRFNNTYHFTSPVEGRSVRDCMAQMDIWHHADPACEMKIVFSSPGGSVTDGMALFDYIRQMHDKGHRIVTSTLGYAASMAGILLQAGDHREMGRQSYLLIHQISFGTGGSFGEVEDTVNWVKMMQSRVLDIFADRSKIKRKDIEARWKRKDWWIDSEEALKLGFVDEIV